MERREAPGKSRSSSPLELQARLRGVLQASSQVNLWRRGDAFTIIFTAAALLFAGSRAQW